MRTLTFKQVNREWDALLSESIDKYEQGNDSPLVISPDPLDKDALCVEIQDTENNYFYKIDTEYDSLLNFGQLTRLYKISPDNVGEPMKTDCADHCSASTAYKLITLIHNYAKNTKRRKYMDDQTAISNALKASLNSEE